MQLGSLQIDPNIDTSFGEMEFENADPMQTNEEARIVIHVPLLTKFILIICCCIYHVSRLHKLIKLDLLKLIICNVLF